MAAKLAIYGGGPVLGPDVVKAWPHVTAAEREAIAEVVAGESIGGQRELQAERLACAFADYIARRRLRRDRESGVKS